MFRLAALPVLLLLSSCSSDTGSTSLMLDVDLSQFITAEKATSIARAKVPNAIPIDVELELDDDDDGDGAAVFAWEVKLIDSNKAEWEVEINAITAAVIEVELESKDDDGDD